VVHRSAIRSSVILLNEAKSSSPCFRIFLISRMSQKGDAIERRIELSNNSYVIDLNLVGLNVAKIGGWGIIK
jgi:hypothetical protein